MRSFRSSPTSTHRRRKTARGLQAVLLAGSLLATPWLVAAGPGDQGHEGHASPVAMPGWTQTLKGQTVVEDALEGRAGRSEKIELQHHRLMRKIEEQAQQDAQAQPTSGLFNNMSMMHQYMGQDGSSFLLMTDPSKKANRFQ
jgi:manganese oxidase